MVELIMTDLDEKKRVIEELRNRISICAQSGSAYKEMCIQYTQMRNSGEDSAEMREECEKQAVVVEQQKLQLNSDVHFLLEKESLFIEQSVEIVG